MKFIIKFIKLIMKLIVRIVIMSLIIVDILMVKDYIEEINFEFFNFNDFVSLNILNHINNNEDELLIESSLDKDIDISEKFKHIKLDMNIKEAINLVGSPSRIDPSSYGFEWYVYNMYDNDLFMIGVDNNKVVGLYSNTTYNNHLNDIQVESTKKDYILENYTPLEGYNDDERDILKSINHSIVVFYDIHRDNIVTSYEVIKNKYYYKRNFIFNSGKFDLENSNIYNEELENAMELQMFDLINSTRNKFNLHKLELDKEKAHISSKKHAVDMKEKNYFEHENKEGKSPFDRMKDEELYFRNAGENLAGGQIDSIYAHEALMNSKGHRDITLSEKFEYVGIGVEFGGDFGCYYVQNYYSN